MVKRFIISGIGFTYAHIDEFKLGAMLGCALCDVRVKGDHVGVVCVYVCVSSVRMCVRECVTVSVCM